MTENHIQSCLRLSSAMFALPRHTTHDMSRFRFLWCNALGAPVGPDGTEQVDSSGAVVVFPATAPAPARPPAPTEGATTAMISRVVDAARGFDRVTYVVVGW